MAIEQGFAAVLLNWYQQHARRLPWRSPPRPEADNGLAAPDAYAIWVSEIMLQQTRVETVIPYFERWMKRFPTLAALAQASQQEVLAAWEGLGYYSRARNLQQAAQQVMAEYQGELPRDLALLRKLPGVGAYTAGAIASIAFGQNQPTLDGNIRRVLARLFNLSEPARSPAGERQLWAWAAENLPSPDKNGRSQAGQYNQALMDLGATICTPRQPACERCPLIRHCQAYQLGLQAERPVMKAKATIPHYTVTAAVIRRNAQVLITQRPLNGLLGGLWEFPGGKLQPGEDLPACLEREIREELGVEIEVGAPIGVYRHAYTHFRVTLHAFDCRLAEAGEPRLLQVNDIRWVKPAELNQFPMGKIDRQISNNLNL